MSCQGIPASLVGKGLAYLYQAFGDGVLEPHVISGADKRILWSSPSITSKVIDMQPRARRRKFGIRHLTFRPFGI